MTRHPKRNLIVPFAAHYTPNIYLAMARARLGTEPGCGRRLQDPGMLQCPDARCLDKDWTVFGRDAVLRVLYVSAGCFADGGGSGAVSAAGRRIRHSHADGFPP